MANNWSTRKGKWPALAQNTANFFSPTYLAVAVHEATTLASFLDLATMGRGKYWDPEENNALVWAWLAAAEAISLARTKHAGYL